jgi:hypothetical protein
LEGRDLWDYDSDHLSIDGLVHTGVRESMNRGLGIAGVVIIEFCLEVGHVVSLDQLPDGRVVCQRFFFHVGVELAGFHIIWVNMLIVLVKEDFKIDHAEFGFVVMARLGGLEAGHMDTFKHVTTCGMV